MALLQDFQQFYSDVVGKLWFKHPPEVTGKVERGSPPHTGDLAPHPMGEVWSKSLLDLYRIMQEDSDSSDTGFPGFYYYPLLARHCSDVNLEGESYYTRKVSAVSLYHTFWLSKKLILLELCRVHVYSQTNADGFTTYQNYCVSCEHFQIQG